MIIYDSTLLTLSLKIIMMSESKTMRVHADEPEGASETSAAAKYTRNHIPHVRGRLEAIVELLYSGAWLGASMKYDDYPGDTHESNRDVGEFCTAQTNIAVLAALMLTILAAFLFEFANKATYAGCAGV